MNGNHKLPFGVSRTGKATNHGIDGPCFRTVSQCSDMIMIKRQSPQAKRKSSQSSVSSSSLSLSLSVSVRFCFSCCLMSVFYVWLFGLCFMFLSVAILVCKAIVAGGFALLYRHIVVAEAAPCIGPAKSVHLMALSLTNSSCN